MANAPAFPDDLLAAKSAALELLNVVRGTRSIGQIPMFDMLHSWSRDGVKLLPALKAAQTAIEPILPELHAATSGIVQLGHVCTITAYEAVLTLADQTSSLLQHVVSCRLQGGDPLRESAPTYGEPEGEFVIAHRVDDEPSWRELMLGSRQPSTEEWARVGALLVREVMEVARLRSSKTAGTGGPIEVPPFPAKTSLDPVTPKWNRDTGELSFRGKVVRSFRKPGHAKYPCLILTSFEEQGWPSKIDDPLPRDTGGRRLLETLATLRKGLSEITFRGDGSGKGIIWEVANSVTAPS
jgi:hypothetical protein